jgi:Domain of unknown function (DUF4190)
LTPPSYPPPPDDFSLPPPPGGDSGYPLPPPPGEFNYSPSSPVPVGTNKAAIVSLVSSLIGGWFCGIGAIFGIVFGVKALNQIKQTDEGGHGVALAGIISGALILFFWFIYFMAQL